MNLTAREIQLLMGLAVAARTEAVNDLARRGYAMEVMTWDSIVTKLRVLEQTAQ